MLTFFKLPCLIQQEAELRKTDEELINDVQTGTLEAFDQLMQRYQEYVFRIAYGFGKKGKEKKEG